MGCEFGTHERYRLAMKLYFLNKKGAFGLVVFCAVVVYLVTAYHSHGYYHADEHYQIIEFAGLKLGTHAPNELAWEYNAKIRPALQPTICFLLFEGFQVCGFTDPYTQAFLLRLISSLLAIVVITYFVRKTRHLLTEKKHWNIYYLLSYFLWFIPVISVRFSSETWGGLLFLSALAVFYSDINRRIMPYWVGLLLGVSFLLRFQMAFAIAGFGLWLLWVNRSKVDFLLKMLAAFVLVIFMGSFLDYWFYGEWVFTPWNYFYKNIVDGVASSFGTSPWYFYLQKLFSYSSYPVGIAMAISVVLMLFFRPKNVFLWCLVSFVVAHSLISHKEERFLFPMVYLFPFLLTESYSMIDRWIVNGYGKKIFGYILLFLFMVPNVIGLATMAQKSAGIGRMEITRYIHQHYGENPVHLVYCSWSSPYDPWHGLPAKFYLEDCLTGHRINDLCELNDSLLVPDAVNLLVIRKYDRHHAECPEELNHHHLTFEIQSVPKWIEWINGKYQGLDNEHILELYRFDNP